MPLEDIARARSSGEGLKNPIIALARTIAATRIESRIARELYDRNLPDLMMLYLEGTDVIGHVFASYVPPKLACVSDADYARYHRAVDEYYALVDRILGQWMRRAEEDGATLIVNSDHGFKWGEERSCVRDSLNPSTAGFWHRLDGVFAAWGARVAEAPSAAARPSSTSSPRSRRCSACRSTGVPPEASSAAPFPACPRPRARTSPSVPVRRLAAEQMSEKEASEYTKKLLALGYLSGGEPGKLAPSGGDRPGLTEGAWNNLGLYFSVNGGKVDYAAAEAAYRKALELRPEYHSPQFNLAVLYRARGDDRRALDWLFRSLSAGHADPEGTLLLWAAEYREKGKTGPEREVLERGARLYPDSEPVARQLALLRFRARDCAAAEAAVARFAAASQSPDTLNVLGLLSTCLGRPDAAVAFFRRSLAINPDQPGAIRSLDLLQKGLPPGEKRP